MRKTILGIAVIVALGAIACNGEDKTTLKNKNQNEMEITNKQKVVALLKSIETGDQEPISYVNPNKYIQHNLAVEDGLEGFGAVLQQLPPNSAKVNTIRAFKDGDYVFTHTDYNFFGPKIGFDVFKFENGLITEHWDNLQEKPQEPNPSNHTMIDGPVEVEDLEKTEANKKLVASFVNEVLVNGKLEEMEKYFDGDHYIQHNPQIADGLSGLKNALEYLNEQGISMAYQKVHHVIGEGNFVLVISEGIFADQSTSFYDLFRVKEGKIAEHWDVMEGITPKEEARNNNGKFNF